MNLWWKEENWPRLKKYLERLRNPTVYGVCDERYLGFGKDTVPRMTAVIFLKSIGGKPITYDNTFPLRKRAFLLQKKVNYVEDIIFTRDMEKYGMVMKEVIQILSDIGQANYYVQEDNHLDCLTRENRLPNMKRHRQVFQAQAKTT